MWTWLSNSKNQKTLAWFGAALLAVASAVWTAYEKIKDDPVPAAAAVVVIPAASQVVAAQATNNAGQQAIVDNISGGTVSINQTIINNNYYKIQKVDPQLAEAYLKQAETYLKQAETVNLLVRQSVVKDQSLQDKDAQIARLQEELAAGALRLAGEAHDKPDDADVKAARDAYLLGDTSRAEALFRRLEDALVDEARKQQLEMRKKLAKAASIARERAAMAIGRNTAAAVDAWSKVVEYEPEEPGNWGSFGDLLVTAGNLNEAAQAYRRFNQLAEARASSEPDNRQRQRDLSVSFDRIGDVQVAQGDLPGALTSYNKGMAIRDKLAANDPTNTERQTDVVVSYVKLAQCAPVALSATDARLYLNKALTVARRLQSENRLTAQQQRWPKMIEQMLTGLQ